MPFSGRLKRVINRGSLLRRDGMGLPLRLLFAIVRQMRWPMYRTFTAILVASLGCASNPSEPSATRSHRPRVLEDDSQWAKRVEAIVPLGTETVLAKRLMEAQGFNCSIVPSDPTARPPSDDPFGDPPTAPPDWRGMPAFLACHYKELAGPLVTKSYCIWMTLDAEEGHVVGHRSQIAFTGP